MKRFFQKFLKILLYIFGGIITLVLLLLLLIQFPAVQNFIKKEAVAFIEGKIETPVRINKLEIGFPKKIILNGFYFEDQNQDTLVAGDRLAVNINFYKLLSNTVDIASIELEGAVANISRDKDSVFNFDYIITAFATDEPKDTTAAAMEISIDNVDLDRIRFRMKDAVSGSDLDVNLNHLDTQIGIFDLENMTFEIPEITIDGLAIQMLQDEMGPAVVKNLPSEDVANDEAPLTLMLKDINLKNISISMSSDEAQMDTAFALEQLVAEINEIQLEKEYADISSLQVKGLEGNLTLRQIQTPSEAVQESTQDTAVNEPANNWRVRLQTADFENIAFRYKDENAPPVPQGIDYMNLDLTNVNLEANDFYYSQDTIMGNINNFTLLDHSGLEVNSLQTNFMYSNTGAYLRDLYLETPKTVIRAQIEVRYTSLETLENDLGEVFIEANLNNSRISFEDILLLAPDLRNTNPFKSNPTAVLQINGAVNGTINDLSIPNFEAEGIGSTQIALDGNITGLPDAENAYYNINIKRFQATARDIEQFVPDGTIPDSIQLPERFSAIGNFRGTVQNFATRLNLESSNGNATVDATIDMRRENAERYVADVSLNEFDLGRLIMNDSIGTLTLNLQVNGTGFDPATANATAAGAIERAVYNNYVYRDLQFEGEIANGEMNAEASMNDPNLDFNLVTSGNFSGEYPSLQLNANLINVALDSLNLYSSPLRFEGEIIANLETADPDHLNGEILLTNFLAANATQIFPLDTIAIRSTATAQVDSLILSSQFINARLQGQYQLTKIGTALTNSISQYYNLNAGSDTLATTSTDTIQPQQFTFNIAIENDPILTRLIPDLNLVEPVNISGRFNSVNDSIQITGTIPRMSYLEYRLVNTSIDIETVGDALTYELIIDDLDSPQIQLFHTEITGEVANNVVDYQLLINDSTGEAHYQVAGNLEADGNLTRISLNPETLLLNYDSWDIPQDNSIIIAPEGVQATNFNLSYNSNAIRINSQTQDPASPMEIQFENFQLETLSAMVSKDTLLATGTLNGDVTLNNLATSPEFNTDLSIENFSFKRDTLGNLQIDVNNQTANTLEANVTISGRGNNVELAGLYGTIDGDLDFDLDIQHLNIESIQGFSYGSITDGEGHLSGDLRIEGTAEAPTVIGDLDFNQVGLRVTTLNSFFQNMNESISFTNEGIRFNSFTLADEDNNKLTVNGMVQTTDYASYGFDLTVEADNFRAINSTEDDNDFFYGILIMDTSLIIGGTMDNPRVRGSLSINEGTDLSVVLPQDDPAVANREGVVEFVDEASLRMAQMKDIEETVNTSQLQGMDVSVNVDIIEEAMFTIVIDQGNGDFLKLQGDAQLTAGIDPSGRTNLTGRYEFNKGAYEMSFNFIRRRFDIQEGSFIQWTGEPTDATIDITAIYETETAPLDLLGNQLANLTQGQRNTYKQELPFQTILRMEGELLEPVLSFDIRLPQRNYNVSADIVNNSRAKLAQLRQQPSELNKQVFALLLLNRFIGENPFSSEGGGMSAETMARQSVSKILSQQLNDLAGDLISGVQLEFDLESTEDYTTGQREQRTDLNVGLSKTLMDDRLKVTIGSTLGIEGPQQANQQANNIAGDIAVDYQLSKDGRYMLRAFRRNLYEVALQGQIIETGVAFIITMDYNKFMEIFGRTYDDKNDGNDDENDDD